MKMKKNNILRTILEIVSVVVSYLLGSGSINL